MDIMQIWVTQRKLRSRCNLLAMVECLLDGGTLPKIVLSRDSNGSVQVDDGHHRLVAHGMVGFGWLDSTDYLLVEKDQWRPRFGNVIDLLDRSREGW